MKRLLRIVLLALPIIACSTFQEIVSDPTEIPGSDGEIRPLPSPTQFISADSFFDGCAYLDTNGNGLIDAGDPKLAGFIFSVTFQGGAWTDNRTSEIRCAMAHVPGGLNQDDWPVTARMRPPVGSNFELIGPEEVLLEFPLAKADFLFTTPAGAVEAATKVESLCAEIPPPSVTALDVQQTPRVSRTGPSPGRSTILSLALA